MTGKQLLERALGSMSADDSERMARLVGLEFLAHGIWCRYSDGRCVDVETDGSVVVRTGDITLVRFGASDFEAGGNHTLLWKLATDSYVMIVSAVDGPQARTLWPGEDTDVVISNIGITNVAPGVLVEASTD